MAGKGAKRAPRARASEAQARALRRTRREHAQETAEDYVEAIADLAALHGEARTVDLARRLGVTHATVVRTVGRLKRDGWVSSEPYRSIFLTEKGARLAQTSRLRHETVLAFLRALGVSEATAQADAEGIEHHVSKETLDAFRRLTERKKPRR